MNSIEKVWKNFLRECFENGEWVVKDDGDEILEIIDNHSFIPNIVNDVVMEGQPFNLDIFIKLIEMGAFNIRDYPFIDDALSYYVKQLDDPSQIYNLTDDGESNFVYTYSERIFNIKQSDRIGNVDYYNQFDVMVDRLRKHIGSNRAIANLYMCGLDKDEQHIPCLQFIGAFIRNNKLGLHILFRSNDLYSAFPSNMMFLQYLGLKLVEELKSDYPTLKFEGLYYNSVSLHIYKGDYEQVKSIIDKME